MKARATGEPAAPEREPTFEEALERLEQIATRLEGEDLELAESLDLYEEGVRLLRFAGAVLAHVEDRVRQLHPDGAGFRLESPGEEP